MDRHVPRFTGRHRQLGPGSRGRRLELLRTAALRGDSVHGVRGVKEEGRASSQAEGIREGPAQAARRADEGPGYCEITGKMIRDGTEASRKTVWVAATG